jgi:hypothetical protein
MNKIVSSLLLFMLYGSVAFADSYNVEMHIDTDMVRKTGPHSLKPRVNHDDDRLIIKADLTLKNARIVVKNKFGQVLYDGILDIKKQPQVLYVPDSDKRSIEIYCGKEVYWGVFEED